MLLDRILSIEPNRRIVARKALTGAEEYLADHFPTFPVMPGVFMLEAMVQAGAWLVHASTDFRYSLLLLREARNVTYKSFVTPGDVLELEVTTREFGEERSTFDGVGRCDSADIVKARFTLGQECMDAQDPKQAERHRRMVAWNRERFALLEGSNGL